MCWNLNHFYGDLYYDLFPFQNIKMLSYSLLSFVYLLSLHPFLASLLICWKVLSIFQSNPLVNCRSWLLLFLLAHFSVYSHIEVQVNFRSSTLTACLRTLLDYDFWMPYSSLIFPSIISFESFSLQVSRVMWKHFCSETNFRVGFCLKCDKVTIFLHSKS